MKIKSAISKINKNGILLVFPINNKPEPQSIWSSFYPKDKMVWEWNEDSDDRVGELWLLMKKLSDSRQVVYSKWYQGRATFFSRDLFRALLRLYFNPEVSLPLSHGAQSLLEALESDSPLSTKQLKKLTDLQGRFNEPEYNRGLKSLFQKFLIVGFGEVDDGAFSSLAVGATKVLYEDLVLESKSLKIKEAEKTLDQFMPKGSLVRKYLEKNCVPLKAQSS